VVYAKPPFGGPEQVLKYLARYTHRVAISNGRLVSLTEDRISFRWRDSKDGKRPKVMTLEVVEFIRRFLLHILPCGFVKIRHFGFLANRNRSEALRLCRQLLLSSAHDHPIPKEVLAPEQRQAIERRCPRCQQGTLHIVARLTVEELMIYIHPVIAVDYVRLGQVYWVHGHHAQAVEATKKAYKLRGRVSERERLFIDSAYHDRVTGELPKVALACEPWQQTYPRDPIPYGRLGGIYLGEKSLGEYREALRLEPNNVNSYTGASWSYLSLERADQAKEVLTQAQAHKLSSARLTLQLYKLAFLRGDKREMDKQVEATAGQPGSEDWLLATQAETEAYHGRLTRARDFTRQAATRLVAAAIERRQRTTRQEARCGRRNSAMCSKRRNKLQRCWRSVTTWRLRPWQPWRWGGQATRPERSRPPTV
jgi:hypothetical protein